MSKHATVAVALDHLDSLGSPDAIADEMRATGIKSKPGCPEACAVADFITKTVGVYAVTIDGEFARGSYDPLGPGFGEEIPDNVRDFITVFDNLGFPDLISGVHPILRELWDAKLGDAA